MLIMFYADPCQTCSHVGTWLRCFKACFHFGCHRGWLTNGYRALAGLAFCSLLLTKDWSSDRSGLRSAFYDILIYTISTEVSAEPIGAFMLLHFPKISAPVPSLISKLMCVQGTNGPPTPPTSPAGRCGSDVPEQWGVPGAAEDVKYQWKPSLNVE